MDTSALFLACRKGDLTRIEFLVEQKYVELNVRDKWDSTPLYYACLCGHIDVVKYLLDTGARCEAKTFDGERCVYGALNDEIKAILKNYKAVTSSTMRRDVYNEFMRTMLEGGVMSDIVFLVHGQTYPAHRCVLMARCPYFFDLLQSKWKDRTTISLNNKRIHPESFQALLQYLYTGRMDVHFDAIEQVLILAKQCKLDSLLGQLEERKTKILSFECTKPGVCVNIISLEPTSGCRELQNDIGVLADQSLPGELCSETQLELPFPLAEVSSFPDIIFSVEGHHFKCHKVFFCGRSDYFKALLENHFGENTTDHNSNVTVITLQQISAAIFVQVLYYIYQDSCELTVNNVHDVLVAGDMYLLPGLKRQCANSICQFMDTDNIVQILRTSRLFDLSRLEDMCAEFIAANLDQVLADPDFMQFVSEDAATVTERQETDSIPIIDDVRYHITNFVQTFSDMYDADQKLALIDAYLEDMNLEA